MFLAGLQGGMLGVCWMLVWLGISAEWQRRSFWTAENLMASAFYGGSAIRSDFAGGTLSGMAVYLLLYSLLGAVFAVIVRDRMPRSRVLLDRHSVLDRLVLHLIPPDLEEHPAAGLSAACGAPDLPGTFDLWNVPGKVSGIREGMECSAGRGDCGA